MTLQTWVLKAKILGTQAGNCPPPASWLRGGEEGMGESGDAELERLRVPTFP